MSLLGLELKNTIEDALNQVLNSGASSAIMVNPEGFILMSAGNSDDVDETAAVSFVAMVPYSLKSLNNFSKKMIRGILRKNISFKEIIIHQLQFEVSDRKYVGIYVEGYAIIANITKSNMADKTRVALVKAVASIIGLLRKLRESLAIPVAKAEEETVIVEGEIEKKIETEMKEDLVNLERAYKAIEEKVNDIRKELGSGNWREILHGFSELRKIFVTIFDLHPDLRENNVLKAILRWIVKTEAKLNNLARSGVEGPIDASRISILERGLRQLLQHTNKIILRGK